MPKNNIAAPALPARLSELLAALPMVAWVENSTGEILAQGNARVPRADMARPAPCLLPKAGVRRDAEHGTRDARVPRTMMFPLPPIKGCPPGLRLVTRVSDEHKTDRQALIISTLLVLLLREERPNLPRLSPQQRAIYDKLSRGVYYKDAASDLRITYATLRTQVARMRKRHGDEILPRLRRRVTTPKNPSGAKPRIVPKMFPK